jgi:hypothetical protein
VVVSGTSREIRLFKLANLTSRNPYAAYTIGSLSPLRRLFGLALMRTSCNRLHSLRITRQSFS